MERIWRSDEDRQAPRPATGGDLEPAGRCPLLRIGPGAGLRKCVNRGHWGGRAWGVRPSASAAALKRIRLTHAAARGERWPEGAGSPVPIPLSTFVTFRFLPNLTVTREPSALVMCTSYAPSPASVSIR